MVVGITYKERDGHYDKIEIEYKQTWFRKLFKLPQTVTYYGSCTVWHNEATGKRASLDKEEYLANVWSKFMYEKAKR